MNIKEKVSYLKDLKYTLEVAKKCGQSYSAGEVKNFMKMNLIPPLPYYPSTQLRKSPKMIMRRKILKK